MTISPATVLLLLIVLPFAGSCVAALLRKNARNAEAYLAGGVAIFALLLVVVSYPQVTNGGVIRLTASWVPELGLDFTLRMDGFAWLMAARMFWFLTCVAAGMAPSVGA